MTDTAPREGTTPGFGPDQVSLLGWTVPRPTGRWHQAIVVTSRHVWVTPELSFSANQQLETATREGLASFHDFVRNARWAQRPPRVDLAAVRAVDWNETTGWLRVGADEVIGAMIPDRATGTRLHPLLRQAIAGRINVASDTT